MGLSIKKLSFSKRIVSGTLLSVGLISIAFLGDAGAEKSMKQVSAPVRILLTDDTPTAELSIRRKPADGRSLEKLYLNELRPGKAHFPKPQVITPAEAVKPVIVKKEEPSKAALDEGDVSSLPTLQTLLDSEFRTFELPSLNLFPETKQDADAAVVKNEGRSKPPIKAVQPADEEEHVRRTPREIVRQNSTSASPSDKESASSEFPSLETWLPKLQLSQFDFPELNLFPETKQDEDAAVVKNEGRSKPPIKAVQPAAEEEHVRRTPREIVQQNSTAVSSSGRGSTAFPEFPSLETLLPKLELSQFDFPELNLFPETKQDEDAAVVKNEGRSQPAIKAVNPTQPEPAADKQTAVSESPGIEDIHFRIGELSIPVVNKPLDVSSTGGAVKRDSAQTRSGSAGGQSSNMTSKTTMRSGTAPPIYLPEIGSLDGIQFPDFELPMLNLFFGTSSEPLIDSNGDVPVAIQQKVREQHQGGAIQPADEEEYVRRTPREIVQQNSTSASPSDKESTSLEFPSLETWLPKLELSPFELPELDLFSTKKYSDQKMAVIEEEAVVEQQRLKKDETGSYSLEPDTEITRELPVLDTTRPEIPGIKQIPTLAPQIVPDTGQDKEAPVPAAPTPIDDLNKSAQRSSPLRPLVNPDKIIIEIRQPLQSPASRVVPAARSVSSRLR